MKVMRDGIPPIKRKLVKGRIREQLTKKRKGCIGDSLGEQTQKPNALNFGKVKRKISEPNHREPGVQETFLPGNISI